MNTSLGRHYAGQTELQNKPSRCQSLNLRLIGGGGEGALTDHPIQILVLEKKKLRSGDMIYSRAGVGVGPFTPSQCSFHYIPLQNQKPSGSKGDKFTHLKVRRVTFAVFLQNRLKMSFVLTLRHYLLCRKRGVQQANSHL